MNLFGLSYQEFIVKFNSIFNVEYMHKNFIRIKDKITNSVILNCKVPFVIDKKCTVLLVKSLYIHYFKYECCIDYDKYDNDYYNSIKIIINNFITNIHLHRLQVLNSMTLISTECAIESSNNMFFKRQPSIYLKKYVQLLNNINKNYIHINNESLSQHLSKIYI